jgi:hypothetical protein
MDDRKMLVEAGYDHEDVDAMSDEDVHEELAEIPYNL